MNFLKPIKFLYSYFWSIPMTPFRGTHLLNCRAKYNSSWDNERTIEIPLIQDAYDSLGISKFNKDEINVLEIGNVLKNYEPKLKHDVVDKYETGPEVKNVDFLNYKPKKKYDYIFSISTFEHIGYDYGEEKDIKKTLNAFRKVLTMLKPKGKAYITIPVGFNKALDDEIMKGIKGYNLIAFKRIKNWGNQWRQCPIQDAASHEYNTPCPNANAIFVLFKDLNIYDIKIDSEEMLLIAVLLEKIVKTAHVEEGDFSNTVRVCKGLGQKIKDLLKEEIEYVGSRKKS